MATKSTNPDLLFYERAAREYCESLEIAKMRAEIELLKRG